VYADGTDRGGHLVGELGHMDALTDAVDPLPYHGVWHNYCPWEAEDIRPVTD
jgi:hypothetical protein